MGIYTLVISIVIIPFVTFFEFFRKKEKVIDFLTLINFIFILAYGIAPMFLYFFEEYTTWDTIRRTDINESVFFLGGLTALLFYVVTVLTYYLSAKLRFIHRVKSRSTDIYKQINNKQFAIVALILYFVGGLSLVVYMRIVGGFSEFLRVGVILRDHGDFIQHPLMFLKNLTPLLCVATYMFYAFIRDSGGVNKMINIVFFITSLIGGGLSIFHSSGRMQVFIYLITIPLAIIVHKNKIKLRTVVVSISLFLFLIIFGNQLLNLNTQQSFSIDRSNMEIAGQVIQEFSFPYTNIGNVIKIFPNQENFRLGVMDVLSAAVQPIPSRIIDFDFMHRDTASDFNTSLYNKITGEIPVDIVTFGYMSFGLAGVVILAVLFGVFAKLIESLFFYTESMIASIFYISWMVLIGFRIMYGDPEHFVYSSFRYLVAMGLIYLVVALPKGRRVVWKSNKPVRNF